MRRRTRCCIRVAVLGPLLVVLGVAVFLRSPMLGAMVARQVGGRIGCDFDGGAYVLKVGGGLTIERPRLRVRGLQGEAAEILRADRVEIDLDWSGAPLRGPRPSSVRLYSPVFRVGVETESGEINLDALRVPKGAGGPVGRPPQVSLVGGRLEFGEYSAESWVYRRLTSVPVEGALEPVEGTSPAFTVRLAQTGRASGAPSVRPAGGGRGGSMLLEGRVDLATSDAELSLVNVNLDEWPPEVIPTAVRDVWRRLNVRGRVESATLKYARGSGAHAVIKVDGVAMDALVPADLPEEAEAGAEGPTEPLRLKDVSGTIKLSRAGVDALLEGVVGDLPGRVSLRTSGTGPDAPLRCEITTARFTVSESPELMPYAPRIVRKNFATFSGPTAVVDARVLLERGAPTEAGPAPIRASGSIAFENGRAAFDKFPYPFSDMKGLVTFDEEQVRIVNIQGRGPSGAILFAEGSFVPPDEDAHVVIDVLVLDVPVDDVLRDALPGERRGVIDELFNQRRYDELVGKGLVQSPEGKAEREAALVEAKAALAGAAEGEAGELAERVRELEEALRAPVLALGGTAQLAIRIERPAGPESKFSYDAQVKIPRAGLVPQGFPAPIVAEDVSLRLTEEFAELTGGRFAGLTGGTAELSARIELRDGEDRPVFRPFVTVRASDVPVDALLVNAIPERAGGAADGADAAAGTGLSPKRLLGQLNIEGMVDCVAAITPAAGNTGPGRKIAIDVNVDLEGLRAGPDAPAGAEALRLEDVAGRIRVTDRALEVLGLTGRLEAHSAADGGAREAGAFEMGAVARFADPAAGTPASLRATVDARNLDVSAPLEQLVRLVSERAGEMGGALRKTHKTEGRVDVRVEASQEGTSPTDLSVRVGAARGLEFDALEGRFGVEVTGGAATLRVGGAERVEFEDLAAAVAFNGRPVMEVELDGGTPILGRSSAMVTDAGGDRVRAKLKGVKLESDLARAAWRAWQGGAEKAAWLEKMDPRGELDAELTIEPRVAAAMGVGVGVGAAAAGGDSAGGTQAAAGGGTRLTVTRPSWSRYRFGGTVSPRSLAFVHNGSVVDLPTIEGRVVVDDRAGRFEGIRAAAGEDRWRVQLDGAWESQSASWGSGVKVDTTFSLWGRSLEPSITALLPRKVRSMIEGARLRVDGPISVENARLAFWLPGRGGEAAAREHAQVAPGAGTLLFDGSVAFSGLAAQLGAPLRDGAGKVDVLVLQAQGAASPKVDATLSGESMTVGGVQVTNVRGRAVTGSRAGQVLIPQLSADCFGGRLLASGVLDMPVKKGNEEAEGKRIGSGGVAAGTAYQISATLAGARFAPLVEAITSKGKRRINSEDDSRGRMDATVSLSGRIGDDNSRVGRGSVRVAGGEVVKLPGIVRMIEMSNFQLPSAEKLDYAQADFGLKGKVLSVDQVAVMSESLTIMGDGTITLPEMELSMRFNSQAAAGRRIPLISGLFEAVRNELVTTVVEGTIKKPRIRAETLSGTRRMVAGVFGDGSDRKRPDAKAGARAARSERDRLRSRQPAPSSQEAPAIVLPRRGAAATSAGAKDGFVQADESGAGSAPGRDLR